MPHGCLTGQSVRFRNLLMSPQTRFWLMSTNDYLIYLHVAYHCTIYSILSEDLPQVPYGTILHDHMRNTCDKYNSITPESSLPVVKSAGKPDTPSWNLSYEFSCAHVSSTYITCHSSIVPIIIYDPMMAAKTIPNVPALPTYCTRLPVLLDVSLAVGACPGRRQI